MDKLRKIKYIIQENKRYLEERYRVKQIGIFGSFARGEEHKSSDIDILVEFKEPIGLFEFMDLEEYLENLLQIKVDLVSKKALKPRIGEYILKEVEYV